MQIEPRKIQIGEDRFVSSAWAIPESYSPTGMGLILAHGAGAGMDHEWMVDFQRRLCGLEILTVRFNFLYKELGRRFPDRPNVLERTYTAVVDALRQDPLAPSRLFLGGKSMGGRMASHLAAAGEEISGLVLLGYPLHPPGRTQTLRTGHWPRLDCPALFVQGSRDRLCDLSLLDQQLPAIAGPTTLHVVEGGDHSLNTSRKPDVRERTRAQICRRIHSWMQEVQD